MRKFYKENRLSAYSYGAIWLHWLAALAIMTQLGAGYAMMHVADISDQTRFLMFQWHKTIGVLVLLVTLARIAWRLMNKPPAKAPMRRIEKRAAETVSFVFYVLMLAVPLTGWLLVSASQARIPTLLFLVPGLVWPNLPVTADIAAQEMAANAHAVLAYSFIFLLFLHVGGALKHSMIDRIPEMSRMVPTGRLAHKAAKKPSAVIAVLVFALAGGSGILLGRHLAAQKTTSGTLAQQAALPSRTETDSAFKPDWTIDYKQSSLTYQLDFSGAPQNGQVAGWKANIRFDPARPDTARAEIIIDAASIRYDDSFVSGNIAEKDGLDIAAYPQIYVLLDRFTPQPHDWLATGTLTIRGITRPLALHFTFHEQGRHANVSGHAELDRLDFHIGQGNDPDGAWLGKIIRIKIQLVADKN